VGSLLLTLNFGFPVWEKPLLCDPGVATRWPSLRMWLKTLAAVCKSQPKVVSKRSVARPSTYVMIAKTPCHCGILQPPAHAFPALIRQDSAGREGAELPSLPIGTCNRRERLEFWHRQTRDIHSNASVATFRRSDS